MAAAMVTFANILRPSPEPNEANVGANSSARGIEIFQILHGKSRHVWGQRSIGHAGIFGLFVFHNRHSAPDTICWKGNVDGAPAAVHRLLSDSRTDETQKSADFTDFADSIRAENLGMRRRL